MAQPNLDALSQHLIGVSNEIVLFPNLPIANINQQLNQMNQQLQQLAVLIAANHAAVNGQFVALNGQVAGLAGQVAQFVVAQNLLPMRLQNASSSINAHLRYPPGFVMGQAPVRKQDLLSVQAGVCQTTAQALGLPPLLGNPSVAQRRQQIIDHLGAGLTA